MVTNELNLIRVRFGAELSLELHHSAAEDHEPLECDDPVDGRGIDERPPACALKQLETFTGAEGRTRAITRCAQLAMQLL